MNKYSNDHNDKEHRVLKINENIDQVQVKNRVVINEGLVFFYSKIFLRITGLFELGRGVK